MTPIPRAWVEKWNTATARAPWLPLIGEVDCRGRKWPAFIGESLVPFMPIYVVPIFWPVSDV